MSHPTITASPSAMTIFTADAIANYFLDLSEKDGVDVSPMKLQKLVYFAHGWHLAIYKTPLINEQVEAWQWGPVIRSLYHEFKDVGSQSIHRRAIKSEYSIAGGIISRETWEPSIDIECDDAEHAERIKALLRRVWRVYSGFSANQLSKMTHAANTPWDKVQAEWNGDPPKGTDIPQESIINHFSEKALDSD